MKTKKALLTECQKQFGFSATNEFIKRCLDLAVTQHDFFFDVLTNCVFLSYANSDLSGYSLSDIRIKVKKGDV